ncbi:homeobox protein Hox-C4a-like [Pocillopora verrucosa]|uniref:homeobox protein Hox-C4a-like n=1 Tax=Pocillopora verrucosa TaxID=203993 RepID=UPI00333E49EB
MIHQKNLNQSERSQPDYPRPATICYAGREERWNRHTDNSDEKVFLIDGAIKESGTIPQEALELATKPAKLTARRSRTKFTTHQKRELEKTFSCSPFLSMQNYHRLTQELGISEKIIKTWFKNRRVKWRKDSQRTRTNTTSTSGPSRNTCCLRFDHLSYSASNLEDE